MACANKADCPPKHVCYQGQCQPVGMGGLCDPPCVMGEKCQPTQDGGQCVPASSPTPDKGGGQGQCGPVPNTNPPVPRSWDQGRQRCVPNCGGGMGYDGKLKKCRACQPGESMSEQGRCLPGLQGGGDSGGGGGGGGGGAAASSGFNSMDLLGLGSFQSGTIWDTISKMLSGQDAPFSPEIVAGLEGKAVGARESAIERMQEGVERSAIQRGMFGAGATGQQLLEARQAGEQDFSSNITQIRTQAALANFQAKMGALDKAQRWLDSLRDYAARLDQTQASREAAAAGIALGYAQIEYQKYALQQNLGFSYEQLNLQKMLNTICFGSTCIPWDQFQGTFGA